MNNELLHRRNGICYFMRQDFAVLNQNTSSVLSEKNYGPLSVFRKLNSKILAFPLCLFGLSDTLLFWYNAQQARSFTFFFLFPTPPIGDNLTLCFLNCDLSCFNIVPNQDDRVMSCETSELLGSIFIENTYVVPKVYSTS